MRAVNLIPGDQRGGGSVGAGRSGGAAYAVNKDKANARLTLEKALKLQPSFQGSDDARSLLAKLKG